MKTILALMALALSSFALAAAPDPCKLLAPGEVKSGLGAPAVISRPDPAQDIPTCNFDFEGGGMSVGVTTGAAKMLGGKSLLALVTSSDNSGTTLKGMKPLSGLGDEAVGAGGSDVNGGVPSDTVMLYVRRGDTLLVLTALDSNHAASKVNLQSVILLAKRALLRLH